MRRAEAQVRNVRAAGHRMYGVQQDPAGRVEDRGGEAESQAGAVRRVGPGGTDFSYANT